MWMEATLFESTISVLVNGNLTKDFQVCRGLRQGDPLSPFLFVITAKGLYVMMKNDVRFNLFKGFQVNEHVAYNLVQFTDDKVLIGDASWENLWGLTKWIGVDSLANQYHDLYRITINQDGKLVDNGYWRKGVWVWAVQFKSGAEAEEVTNTKDVDNLKIINSQRHSTLQC